MHIDMKWGCGLSKLEEILAVLVVECVWWREMKEENGQEKVIKQSLSRCQ